MFLTQLRDFDYCPYILAGKIKRGEVVSENAILWECVGELPPGVDRKIVVNGGFVTDLASIPWFVKWAIIKLGRHQRAAVLHDWLYRNTIGTKEWADGQFNQAMIEDGVVEWRRKVIMFGLKIGGHKAWGSPKAVIIV